MPTNTNDTNNTLTFGEFSVSIDSLSEEAAKYLLQYGFAQSLQDAVAGKAKAFRELVIMATTGNDPVAKKDAENKVQALAKALGITDDLELYIQAETTVDELTEAYLAVVQKARLDAILAGTIGHRAGGTKLRGIDAVMRDIAVEKIRMAAAKKKVTLPKGDELKALVKGTLEKHGATIRAEAERRMNEAEFEVEL